MSDNWKKVENLFNKAIEIEESERIEFLKNECGDDANLLNEVVSLLKEDQTIHPLLDKKASELINVEEKLNFVGEKIGNYKLVDEIATGGMGTVFLAERCDGVFEQKVALKIIKPGLSTIPIIRRFQHERQILANLQHPNIARLFDGGVTDDRRPFFTMEFVDGIPIDEYCDNNKLNIDQRLKLFIKVCETVQYAHNNLVIHRDLKPSNILIEKDGSIKLLDFGISKVLSAETGEHDLPTITQAEINLLTPEYSSPEQIKNSHISVSADVYSLGLILYKLLSGKSAYEFQTRTFNEFEKVICDQQITKPSTIISNSNCEKEVFENRKVQPEKLRKILNGDLDNICLMALRKEPERRYASVEMFAYDIQRYLDDLPILARKESFSYTTKKFVKRNKTAVIANIALFFIINGLILFYTIQLKEQRDKANLEARKAEQVASFLQELFLVSDPSESKGETITARELLDRGANRLKSSLQNEPEIKSQLQNTIGKVYTNLGLYNSAEEILLAIKKNKFKEQIDKKTYVESLINLGKLYRIEGKYDLAKDILNKALEESKINFNNEHPSFGDCYLNLGGLFYEKGEYENSRESLFKAENIFRINYGNNHEKLAVTIHDLGMVEFDTGNLDKADSLYRIALGIELKLKGEINANVAEYQNGLGRVLRHKGEYEEAKLFYEKALITRRKLFGNNHASVAHTLNHLSRLYYNQEMYDEAEPLARQALEIRKNIFEDNHPEVSASRSSLAGVLFYQGRFVEAELLYRKAYKASLSKLGESHPYTPAIQGNLGRTLLEQGKYQEAEKHLLSSYNLLKKIFNYDHKYIISRVNWISELFIKTGRQKEAEVILRKQIDSLNGSSFEDHWMLGETHSLLGYCLFKQSKDQEAEGSLVFGLNLIKEKKGITSSKTQKAIQRIIEFYKSKKRTDKVIEYSAKLK